VLNSSKARTSSRASTRKAVVRSHSAATVEGGSPFDIKSVVGPLRQSQGLTSAGGHTSRLKPSRRVPHVGARGATVCRSLVFLLTHV
jgi:hypothetical protein